MSMSIEDNTFDHKVRERLMKESKSIHLFFDPHKTQLLIDMITYCSQGNQEAAVLNFRTTLKFERDYEVARLQLPGVHNSYYYLRGLCLMFEFWRKCFIQIKVAVQKQESLPRESWHEVILREYGRFLNSHNFANTDVFDTEVRVVRESLKNESEAFNNTYKALIKRDG